MRKIFRTKKDYSLTIRIDELDIGSQIDRTPRSASSTPRLSPRSSPSSAESTPRGVNEAEELAWLADLDNERKKLKKEIKRRRELRRSFEMLRRDTIERPLPRRPRRMNRKKIDNPDEEILLQEKRVKSEILSGPSPTPAKAGGSHINFLRRRFSRLMDLPSAK